MLALRILWPVFFLILASCQSLKPTSPSGSPTVKTETGSTPESAPLKPKKEMKRFGIVLGGVGVSSFASIGIFKKISEERLKPDYIVATGWPAIFALAYAYMPSIHDLEWFAMRIKPSELEDLSRAAMDQKYDAKIPSTWGLSLEEKVLHNAKFPLVLSIQHAFWENPEVVSSGSSKEALIRSILFPGLFKIKIPPGNITNDKGQLHPLDVEEARRRSEGVPLSFSMYSDYLGWLGANRYFNEPWVENWAKATETRLETLKQEPLLVSHIRMGVPTEDLSLRRAAILAGYREATEMFKKLRQMQ